MTRADACHERTVEKLTLHPVDLELGVSPILTHWCGLVREHIGKHECGCGFRWPTKELTTPLPEQRAEYNAEVVD